MVPRKCVLKMLLSRLEFLAINVIFNFLINLETVDFARCFFKNRRP